LRSDEGDLFLDAVTMAVPRILGVVDERVERPALRSASRALPAAVREVLWEHGPGGLNKRSLIVRLWD
jgi:hypothetical protein